MSKIRLATVVVVRSEAASPDGYTVVERAEEYHGLVLLAAEVQANEYSTNPQHPPLISFRFLRASTGAEYVLSSYEIRSITWATHVQ